ncbi:MAG: Holliday junction branch migration protein RuvA [Parcubacteria group bacterium]|nr:Holliday junction branch migration protein RuvA [Parcubacteria group bacterium]
MIAQITGIVAQKTLGTLIVETGGIGYKVRVPHAVFQKTKLKEKIALLTHLAVREDSMDLYGFTDSESLGLFEKLITVSGIGPKSALGIVNLAPVSKLVQAISAGDTGYLTKVSGIGKKTAAKIILELKDTVAIHSTGMEEGLREEKDALLALMSLGYGTTEAREALQKIKNKDASTGEKIKEALQLLSR